MDAGAGFTLAPVETQQPPGRGSWSRSALSPRAATSPCGCGPHGASKLAPGPYSSMTGRKEAVESSLLLEPAGQLRTQTRARAHPPAVDTLSSAPYRPLDTWHAPPLRTPKGRDGVNEVRAHAHLPSDCACQSCVF